MKRNYLTAITTIAALASATSAWSAVPIPCPNAGFDIDAVDEGAHLALPGAPTGWTGGYYTDDGFGAPVPGSWTTEEGYRGAYDPGPADSPFVAQSEENVAYCEAYSGYLMALTQTLTDTLLPGLTYDLSVEVGNPGNVNGDVTTAPYRIELRVGDTTVDSDQAASPGVDLWTTASLSYVAPAAGDPLIGKPLTIRIMAASATTGLEVHFDDVTLTRSDLLVPIAVPGGPYGVAIPTGDLSLDGSGSLPPDGGAITTWEWDLDNDGDFDEMITGVTPATIPYATLIAAPPTGYGMIPGDNTIKLRVTDDSLPTPLTSAVVDGTVTLFEPLTTFIGNSKSNGDNWNVGTNWDNGVPSGAIQAVIPASKFVTSDNTNPPIYTGNLSIGAGVTLQSGYLAKNGWSYMNCLGTAGSTVITMGDGSRLWMRGSYSPAVPEITLLGDVRMVIGASTSGSPTPDFGHGINGPYQITVSGKSGGRMDLDAANSFGSLVTTAEHGTNFNVSANVAGAISGDVTIQAHPGGSMTANLKIEAADAISDTATVSIYGNNSTLLWVNADDTIGKLVINGAAQPLGTYGATGSSADNPVSWISGTGILTVAGTGTPAYWDIDDTNPGAGGTTPAGTWDASNTFWNDEDGTGSAAAWTAGDTATFAAGTNATGIYTATVSGLQDIGGIDVQEGTVTVSGDGLRMTANSDMAVASGLTATVSSAISDDGTAWDLFKIGDGSLVLDGANTYTGATNVQGGTLSVASLANAGAASPIGAYASSGPGGLTLTGGGTFQYTGGGTATTDRGLTLSGDATLDVNTAGTALTIGACEANTTTGTLTVTGGAGSSLAMGALEVERSNGPTLAPATGISMTVASVHSDTRYGYPVGTLTLGGTSTGNVVSGNFTKGNTQWEPGMNVAKTGAGTWTLSGTVNCGGSLTVNDGTLLLNGSVGGSMSSVAVNGPGVLGGTGTISKATTVDGTGGLAPGTSAGTLTFTNNLDISALAGGGGGTLAFELDALAAASDQIAVSGILTIGTDALRFTDFTFTDLGGLEVGTYTLITSGTLSTSVDAANASGAIGSLTGTLQVTGNNLELDVTTGAATPYEVWATLNGVTGGFDGDDDGGGTSNGAEWYYFDSDPQVAEGNGSPLTGATKTGANTFVFTHMRPLDRTGMSDPYVWSSALSTWNANHGSEGPITVDILAVGDGGTGGDYETATVTATVSGGTLDELFVRQELSFP